MGSDRGHGSVTGPDLLSQQRWPSHPGYLLTFLPAVCLFAFGHPLLDLVGGVEYAQGWLVADEALLVPLVVLQ